ncbi:MAG: hypothetical protein ACPLPT_04695 [Moorellales bacterium]
MIARTPENELLYRERESLIDRYLTAPVQERSRILSAILDIDRQLGHL